MNLPKKLFILIFLPLIISCQETHKTNTDNKRFLGTWVSYAIDDDTKEYIKTDYMAANYKENGIVTYSFESPNLHEDRTWSGKYSIHNNNSLIIIDENSNEDKYKYEFKTDNELRITFEGHTVTWYRIIEN